MTSLPISTTTASDVEEWMSTKAEGLYDAFDDGHHGHHGDHDHKPNMTVYQLIAGSKYTTKLAAAINEFDDLVEALNSTKANFTVFAPTDKAFEKIPEGAPKPSKKLLKALLSYHVIPDFYPAKRVLFSSTAPTLLNSSSLGSGNDAQRMAFKLTLKGLTVNFYSRVIAVNVFGTNGVVHGLDSLLLPPAPAITEVDLFPGAFSTLELGLYKTGLLDMLNTTDHNGGTLFAPSNGAFEKLGPKANAFLFSKYGLKYLKALLEYHVVPENTLYSDAYYKESSDSVDVDAAGKIHVDLPTLLKDRSLSIDIGRYGPVIVINVNGFNRVAASDVVAEDGVIHVMSSVIVPPKKLANNEYEQWTGGEISEEELIERLEPYVNHAFKLDL